MAGTLFRPSDGYLVVDVLFHIVMCHSPAPFLMIFPLLRKANIRPTFSVYYNDEWACSPVRRVFRNIHCITIKEIHQILEVQEIQKKILVIVVHCISPDELACALWGMTYL